MIVKILILATGSISRTVTQGDFRGNKINLYLCNPWSLSKKKSLICNLELCDGRGHETCSRCKWGKKVQMSFVS